MTDRENFEVRERDFRLRWHQAHVARFTAETRSDEESWRERRIAPHAAEAQPFLESLRRTRDLSAFQAGTDRWVRSFDSGFSGIAGQMIINQINKMSSNPDEAVSVLLDALSIPSDIDDGMRKVRLLADHLQAIRVGAHPTPKRAPFVASYFWGLEDPMTWPVAWPKSTDYMEYCTGRSEYADQGERYAELYEFATQVDGGPLQFEQVASWWADERPIIIDEVLCDRAAWREQAQKDTDDPKLFQNNASALVGVAKHIGSTLESKVSQAGGRTLKARKPALKWDETWPRGDFWVDWRVPGTYGLAVRIWLNSRGVAIGLRPYPDAEAQATESALSTIDSLPIPGYEVLAGGASRNGKDVGFYGGGTGEVIYARWFDRTKFASLHLPTEILKAANESAPLVARLNGEIETAEIDHELTDKVAEFISATGYPTPGHDQDKADRRAFAKLLDPEELAIADPTDIRRIWNSGRYGSTGPMSILNTSIRDADEAEHLRIIETFSYICWGDEPPATRIDRVLEDSTLRVKGLGESVIMKLLAITHPEQFVTVYPYGGPKGKLKMLKLLDLPTPNSDSRGQNQVESNDSLKSYLDRYFPGDPLAIGVFLYWLAEHDAEPITEPDFDPLDELAEELLVDREFIGDVVALLEDKK